MPEILRPPPSLPQPSASGGFFSSRKLTVKRGFESATRQLLSFFVTSARFKPLSSFPVPPGIRAELFSCLQPYRLLHQTDFRFGFGRINAPVQQSLCCARFPRPSYSALIASTHIVYFDRDCSWPVAYTAFGSDCCRWLFFFFIFARVCMSEPSLSCGFGGSHEIFDW